MKRKEFVAVPNCHEHERKLSESNGVPGKLYAFESIPPWLQFNRFIFHGYRAQLSTEDCFKSIFYLHNETVNVFSHGIPMLLALTLVPLTASQACRSAPFWFSLHYFACFAPFFASSVYHLFMCHRAGCVTYKNLLTFDVCGVWAVNAFGGLCGIRATLFCFPIFRILSLLFYMIISLTALYSVLIARTPKERFIPLMSFGIMRYFFLAVRLLLWYSGYGCGSNEAVPYYVAMDILAGVGGLLNVCRFPERVCPGTFDILGNGHQFMHILTTMGIGSLHFGAVKDFDWMGEFSCAKQLG